MLYDDSSEQASEFLRLSLTMMDTRKLISNPVNFTLCYEYISGRNPELIIDFDHSINSDEYDKEAACVALFKKHIWDEDKRITNRLRTELSNLITETSNNVGQAHSDVSISAKKLAAHSKNINKNTAIEDMRFILTDVVKETKQVAENGNSLKVMLDHTKNEVEQLRQELEQTKWEATTDPLTGLRNRRAFEKAMQDNIKMVETNDTQLCLVMVDIDHFKRVNDTYGHLFGDRVLKSVASLLMANIKGKDTIARFGGEEFAIMLPDTQLEFAEIVAENLRKAVERARIRKTNTGELLDKLTVSLGITHFHSGEATDEFIDRADKALYLSKENGRNRVTTQT